MRIALLADIHNNPYPEVIEAVKRAKPDIITVAGDFLGGQYPALFRELTEIAPTFVSLGNHDIRFRRNVHNHTAKTKAVLLDNEDTAYGGALLGGLSSKPDLRWLDGFSRKNGYKILLCHHPEYYRRYLRKKDIDLILSGHAHGGQICLLGHGLYAPGQGFFPRYTGGVYEGRLVVSRGIANTASFPRYFNAPEVVLIRLKA